MQCAFSVDDISSEGGLISKVRNLKPEVVFMHTGFQDLHWNKLNAEDLLNKYKQVIYNLLESTTAQLCISLIVPVPGYPRLDEEIKLFNDLISSFLGKLRSDKKYRSRIFSSCNNRLGGFITRETGKHGIRLFLSEKGQRKAWLLMKDALHRTLNGKRSVRDTRPSQLDYKHTKDSIEDE